MILVCEFEIFIFFNNVLSANEETVYTSYTMFYMMVTLRSFLQTGTLQGSLLTVRVIKQIETNLFIIVDSSRVALLDTSMSIIYGRTLIEGNTFRLEGCQKIDNHTVGIKIKFKLRLKKTLVMLQE